MRDATKEESIILHSDLGTKLYNKIRELNDLPLQAMFNSNGITIFLSLKDVSTIPSAIVTIHTALEPGILVQFDNGAKLHFKRNKDRIYYIDMRAVYADSDNKIKELVINYINNKSFTKITTPSTSITHLIPDDDGLVHNDS